MTEIELDKESTQLQLIRMMDERRYERLVSEEKMGAINKRVDDDRLGSFVMRTLIKDNNRAYDKYFV
jgi:hypothetical protein